MTDQADQSLVSESPASNLGKVYNLWSLSLLSLKRELQEPHLYTCHIEGKVVPEELVDTCLAHCGHFPKAGGCYWCYFLLGDL